MGAIMAERWANGPSLVSMIVDSALESSQDPLGGGDADEDLEATPRDFGHVLNCCVPCCCLPLLGTFYLRPQEVDPDSTRLSKEMMCPDPQKLMAELTRARDAIGHRRQQIVD